MEKIVNTTNIALFIALVVMVCIGIYFLMKARRILNKYLEALYQDSRDPGRISKEVSDGKKYLLYYSLALIISTICIWEILKYLFILEY